MSGNNPPKSPLQLPDLVTLGNDYRLTRSFWIASLAITLYDHLLTVGDEITFIWRGRLNKIRVLFWLNRYWPIANLIIDNIFLTLNHPKDRLCFRFFNWFVYSPFLGHCTIGLILILRIYAIYDRNRVILVVLLVLLITELVAETIMVGFIGVRLKTAHLPPQFTGCIPRHIVHWVWIYWFPMSMFESCLFLLAVAKAVQLTCPVGEGRAPSLFSLLLRDSILYFGGVLSVILTNLIVWIVGRPSLFPTFLSAAFAVHSILGCRMLLNIQQAAHTEERESTAVFTTMDTGPTLGITSTQGTRRYRKESSCVDPT